MSSQAKNAPESQKTRGTSIAIYGALAVNVLMAIAKLGVGTITGSPAMLAEGAHSIADTFNEVFLLLSLRLADSPPDEEHPYGYGQDRFFWSFVAAVFIFITGAVFSLYEGASHIIHPEPVGAYLYNYAVLGAAFIFESTSLSITIREVHNAARQEGQSVWYYIRTTSNTSIKVPLYEDTAALAGLITASTGLALSQTTGIQIFDGLGSIGIGLILLWVAWELGTDSRDFLLGASLLPEDRRRLHEILLSFPEVTHVYRILTMHLGPSKALVNAEVHLIDNLTTDQIEQVLERITAAIHREVPEVAQTFIELHPGAQESAPAQEAERQSSFQEPPVS
jgi:cation diffusion facilitator family transporter